jgi:hypothetical protein
LRKGTVSKIRRYYVASCFKCYAGKAGATGKSAIPNGGNAASYGYAGKAVANHKSAILNGGNAAWYGYAGKSGVPKSPIPNAGNAVGYGYAGKSAALVKSVISNAGKGTAAQVNVDVFGAVGIQRVSKTSGSVVITA